MTKQRDDLLHILGKAYEFYGKTVSVTHTQIWLDALRDYPIQLVSEAFKRYYALGQYMPKPVQILGILDELKARQRGATAPEKSSGRQSPEIAQAWITYMRFAFEFDFHDGAADMPLDRALEIVNREAARLNQPDAIKPEHRIESFWCAKAA